jgi:hypothetical protein
MIFETGVVPLGTISKSYFEYLMIGIKKWWMRKVVRWDRQ